MANSKKPEMQVHDLSRMRGKLKAVGGSMSDGWNNILANQTAGTLWLGHSDAEEKTRKRHAVVSALIGIAPRDELEGMLAAQLLACHNAAMECYRRAMIPEQPLEAWREQLNQANKLSRTYATLLDGLNRHRGKGQQKVTVEHVHVHEGGQAIVGTLESSGGGLLAKRKDQPHAIAHAQGTAMPSPDTTRETLPVPRDAERPLPDARRPLSRRTERQ
jgi:hypothetical protein